MDIVQAALERVSRRSYLDKNIEKEKLLYLIETVNRLNEQSGLTCEFVKDGASAFKGLTVSYGLFKNVKNLIVIKGASELNFLEEKAGYFGQQLLLNAQAAGLSTCWVGANFNRKDKSLNISKNEKAVCVITLGYSPEPTFKERIIRGVTHMGKDKSARMFVNNSDLPPPEWINEGMRLVAAAPSARNTKLSRFIWDGNTLKARIKEKVKYGAVDLGIAKLHFELGAKGKFEFGNGAVFVKK